MCTNSYTYNILVKDSSASALLNTHLPCVPLTAVSAMSTYPTPGPLMSTPLINTGQPTLYNSIPYRITLYNIIPYIVNQHHQPRLPKALNSEALDPI